jgi:hypothetical protein
LVVDALRAPDVRTLHAQLSSLEPRAYNAFHLLYADARDAYLTLSDGNRLQQEVLTPGLHVVTERSLGGDDRARVELARRLWDEVSPQGALPAPDALARLLGTRDEVIPLNGLCVSAMGGAYGTRSSLVLYRHEDLLKSRIFWADGSPDQTSFLERPELVQELRR